MQVRNDKIGRKTVSGADRDRFPDPADIFTDTYVYLRMFTEIAGTNAPPFPPFANRSICFPCPAERSDQEICRNQAEFS